MKFSPIDKIKVGLCFDEDVIPVGILAKLDHKIYFGYDPTFIELGLEISPLRCPLGPGLQSLDTSLFEGLPGVFNDSLPDGWGRLLLDRHMQEQDVMPRQLSPLDRLSHVGHTGMGALVYEPSQPQTKGSQEFINLNALAANTQEVLEGEASDVLQELLSFNGSSAGARPKAMIGVDSDKKKIVHGTDKLPDGLEPWLVKFPNFNDGLDAGAIEYVYSLMAKEAGLEMEETFLFPAQKGAGYFATKRFDRQNGRRLHSHSASGLLHLDFRIPMLEYSDLMSLSIRLAKDIGEAEKAYRLAVFNVLSHNRDDHAKNFSFLMDETGQWKLSPAYDLTFSSGPNGEQSTLVMGKGKNPSISDLVSLGQEFQFPRQKIDDVIDQTKQALGNWKSLAQHHGVKTKNIKSIASKIAQASA